MTHPKCTNAAKALDTHLRVNSNSIKVHSDSWVYDGSTFSTWDGARCVTMATTETTARETIQQLVLLEFEFPGLYTSSPAENRQMSVHIHITSYVFYCSNIIYKRVVLWNCIPICTCTQICARVHESLCIQIRRSVLSELIFKNTAIWEMYLRRNWRIFCFSSSWRHRLLPY